MLTLKEKKNFNISDLGAPYRFSALEMVATPKFAFWAAGLLLLGLMIGIVCFLFLPWRQSVYGAGEIIVFSPMHRPQNIEAQISGRLLHWYVRDGQDVKAGELIADLCDIDPRFLSTVQVETLISQKAALTDKKKSAIARVEALKLQLSHLVQSRGSAVPAATQKVTQSKDRLYAAQQAVDAAEQNVRTTQWQLDRISSLYDKGLRSRRDRELALLDNVRAKTELQRAEAALDVAKKDLDISQFDRTKVDADTSASVDGITAALADGKQTIAGTDRDIFQLDVDINNLKDRFQQHQVHAPCDGRVVRLLKVGAGETVQAGKVLAVIAPATNDRAAAIYIRDWDAPLVAVGREVRLTINGWPSLQFVGWPSIAVGTFAGRVAVIDAIDDGRHYYRVIVTPDTKSIASGKDEPWPSVKFLRPGAQTTGWILLKDVPLWYELWRQFNGFQPTVPQPETTDSKHTQKETPAQ